MHRSLAFLSCLVLLTATLACAQPSLPAKTAALGDPAVQITLGNSTAELAGVWKFHLGDDPAWAKPDLDDSGWSRIDLTPPPGSADPSFTPGWTAQGHAGYSGYAWYRLHVNVQDGHARLALKMPDIFDDAYQVFVNGQRIGQFGRFTDRGVTAYSALPRAFPLPKDLRGGPMTIAVRMWMDSATPFNSADAGGMHSAPVLGHASIINSEVQLDWDDTAHGVGSGFLEMLVLLLALAVSLTHFWMDRTDKAYLWLCLVSLATLVGNAIILIVNFTTWIPQVPEVILTDVIVTPLRIGLWVLFWAYWFRVGPAAWLQRAVWGLVLLMSIGYLLLRPPLYGPVVPVHAATLLSPILLAAKLALAALLIWITYRGIRTNRAEGWVALPAVLLAIGANYQHELRLIHIRAAFSLLGFQISLGVASTMLSLLLVILMLSRRFLESQRRQVRWGWEVEQAREVQHVLIPSKLPQVPGLSIESEYRPAREVGGDFFQIIPDDRDGSVILVFGDVTGKGLCAGMLVALIVGVIHTAAKASSDPASILSAINEQLCERSGAGATCLVMHIDRDGAVTLANAGQLPPYWNGKEVHTEGALPLGTIVWVEYATLRFKLADGDTLMLMSDGIAEAQNESGQLFGFDRINELLRHPISAAEVAAAAQNFGQEDDILVLRVERHTQQANPLSFEPTAVVTKTA